MELLETDGEAPIPSAGKTKYFSCMIFGRFLTGAKYSDVTRGWIVHALGNCALGNLLSHFQLYGKWPHTALIAWLGAIWYLYCILRQWVCMQMLRASCRTTFGLAFHCTSALASARAAGSRGSDNWKGSTLKHWNMQWYDVVHLLDILSRLIDNFRPKT